MCVNVSSLCMVITTRVCVCVSYLRALVICVRANANASHSPIEYIPVAGKSL